MFDSVLNMPVHTMISPQKYIFEYLSGILVWQVSDLTGNLVQTKKGFF